MLLMSLKLSLQKFENFLKFPRILWLPIPILLGLLIFTPFSASSAQSSPTPTPTTRNNPSETALPISDPAETPIPTFDSSNGTTISSSTDIISTITPSPTFSPVYLPALLLQPTPKPYISPEKELYCEYFSNPILIPDNDQGGINRTLTVADNRTIADLDIFINIRHTRVGDLIIRLSHQESGKSITLIDRPGHPTTSLGCLYDHVRTILDDEINSPVEGKCAPSPSAISGIYIPQEALSVFDGEGISGNWTFTVTDNAAGSSGDIRKWCLVAMVSENPPPPTPTPAIAGLPSKMILSGVTGKGQALPLDCESRSAVDWARYFGVSINELTFFNNLPKSNNPDKGFVGSVYGTWGQIPPDPYGIHAEPVAELLRSYGLPAYARRPLRWEELKAEIAAGRPVIAWIIGTLGSGLLSNGMPVYYTPSDGLSTIVARYEHTVVVTGYSSTKVYYLNGGTIYTLGIEQFLDSWSALGNMAITATQ